jgi:CheY-like chemotaxis protein
LRGELERAFADSHVAVAEPFAPPAPSSPEASAQILVADDDDIMAKMIESALRHQGYEVVRARDGAEAVGLATDRQFDLILLDLQMPVMDGFDACQTLRLNPRLNDVPIVLLTAQSHETKLRARSVPGVTDYLLKPFGVTELRANVRDWLTRKSVHPDGSWEAAREPLSGPRVTDCSNSSRECDMGICHQKQESNCLSDLLTLRELEVLELLSDGSSDEMTNDELAIRLAVSGSDVNAD